MRAGFYIPWRSSVCIIYIMCQSGHARFEHFCKIWALCVSQIYIVYIFTCLFSFYTFCYMVIVLKSFFVSKTKFNRFFKMSSFSYSLLPKILKLRRSSLRLFFLIKIVYNQFLLLKNYGLWHWTRSFIWFISTSLESVIFD